MLSTFLLLLPIVFLTTWCIKLNRLRKTMIKKLSEKEIDIDEKIETELMVTIGSEYMCLMFLIGYSGYLIYNNFLK